MRTPDGAEVMVVVRIECVAREKRMHRLEWGFRWIAEKWRISQRYATQDARGARTYPWNDMFDVLIGGKKLAYSTSLTWVYSRADRVIKGESQWGGEEGMEVPWRYTRGVDVEEVEEKVWTAAAVGIGRGDVLEEVVGKTRRMLL